MTEMSSEGDNRSIISRRSEIADFLAMDVMRRANARDAAGARVIHMEVGQPGTPAPEAAREAAAKALRDDLIGYTNALGLPLLREAIAADYARQGVTVSPERIVVTTGSSAGFILAFLAAFDVGDRVLLGAPGYPSYRNILASLGVEVVSHAVGPEDGWCLNAEHVSADVEAQREGSGLAGVMFASPANPTGSVMSPVVLRETIRASRAAGATVISDEIYHGLVYGEARAETALAHDDDVIVVNSFSKYHSMTGWRIGWLVVPDDMVRAIERLAQHLFISAPTLSQYAAVGALSDAARSELEGYRAGYAANRDRLLSALPKMGLSAWAPADGAFYLYVDTTPWGADSLSLAGCILEETDVAVTSGVDFDPERGRHYMRLSYARRGEDIEDGIARLQAFANRI